MTNFLNLRFRTWLVSFACGVLLAGTVQSQRSSDPVIEITTQERLETEAWWPTMANAPLNAYAGSAACTSCHTQGAEVTSMRRAAQAGRDADFLKGATLSAEAAPYRYELSSTPRGLHYAVSSRSQKLSQDLSWAIGAGDLARTFLYQQDGRWMQSEISFYTHLAALDITTGLGRSVDPDLPGALGQPLTDADARSCFGCHTVHATTSAGLNPLHAEPGLGCEACHGPALAHVNRMHAGKSTPSGQTPELSGIFNPATLSPSDSIDFCGACHRTSADAKLSVTQAFGTSVIRFQPYRLEESKCWRATKDERLTCVAYHDPHKPLNRDSLSYDRQCLQCHTGTGHASAQSPAPTQAPLVCPKATANCVSCHMPKVTIASMHGQFTDHYIRVVRASELATR